MSLKPLIVTLLAIFSAFHSFSAVTDTTKTPLLAMAAKTHSGKTILKSANVIYPENLEEHKDEFISYVEKFSENRRAYLIRTYTRSKSFFPKAHVILKNIMYQKNLPF